MQRRAGRHKEPIRWRNPTDRGLVFPAAVSVFVASHENALGIANIQQSVPERSARPPFHCTLQYQRMKHSDGSQKK